MEPALSSPCPWLGERMTPPMSAAALGNLSCAQVRLSLHLHLPGVSSLPDCHVAIGIYWCSSKDFWMWQVLYMHTGDMRCLQMNASHDVARLIFLRCFNIANGNSWCFNYYFLHVSRRMLHETQCFKFFIGMFQVFLSDVSQWMLHETYNVSSVLSGCFKCFCMMFHDTCCMKNAMFSSVLYECFKCFIWMFQLFYLNVATNFILVLHMAAILFHVVGVLQ
jgi:hypothetical protein